MKYLPPIKIVAWDDDHCVLTNVENETAVVPFVEAHTSYGYKCHNNVDQVAWAGIDFSVTEVRAIWIYCDHHTQRIEAAKPLEQYWYAEHEDGRRWRSDVGPAEAAEKLTTDVPR